MPGRLAHGITITFATTSFAAQITGVSQGDQTREAVDASHFGSTNTRPKLLGTLVDQGEVEIEILFDPDDGAPPLNAAPETVTIQFPTVASQTTGAKIEGTGGLTGGSWAATNQELQTGTVTLTWTDAVTYTPGS